MREIIVVRTRVFILKLENLVSLRLIFKLEPGGL